MAIQQPANAGENKPIRDIAFEKLKHAIIAGEIPAGSRMIETLYAQKLHISRTPLREAFRRLEMENLVEYESRRGVVVRAFTVGDVEEIFTIRNALMMLIMPAMIANVTPQDIAELEMMLVQIDLQQNASADALAQLNRAFHRRLEQISAKKRILHLIDSLEDYIVRFSALTIASLPRRTDALGDHQLMIRYLRNKDFDALSSLMNHHLEQSKNACISALAKQNSAP